MTGYSGRGRSKVAIRPKIGERVGFTGWRMNVGDMEPPEQPWLGVVVNIKRRESNR